MHVLLVSSTMEALISGGRWYGGWTNLKSHKRLHMRIDDEPICEIDLNASQPTLFSALLGIRMNVGGDTWTDVYASVVERLVRDEEPTLLRMMVKQVLVEMLGSGNYKRKGPASTDAPKKPLTLMTYNSSLTRITPSRCIYRYRGKQSKCSQRWRS